MTRFLAARYGDNWMLKLLRIGTAIPREPQRSRRDNDELLPLVRSVNLGDVAAKRTLITSILPAVLRVARRVLGGCHPDVEDVAQESVAGFIQALPNFQSQCTVLHFACRITVLTALNARRALKRRSPADDVGCEDRATPDETTTNAPSPKQALLSARRRDLLRGLLDDLPNTQADALVLHCVLGYTVDEIAGMTSVASDTARSRIRLAKNALRNRIANDRILSELLGDAL